ncbi:hypothetical protein [Streptomyces sp. MZ04]|uniref:hypothetical protein n=1 Tax=Streptomyces sp. MZ04 TaxID=2559236 RepID=UPI00107ED2EF|nr:hypothetical protein [Streptomyces sp. MZ04]TGB08291.1 hypothetical protein E2651_19655 [Streptomyces sp. MZ04]
MVHRHHERGRVCCREFLGVRGIRTLGDEYIGERRPGPGRGQLHPQMLVHGRCTGFGGHQGHPRAAHRHDTTLPGSS